MSEADRVVALIDRDELIELTLDLCRIDSAGTMERPVAEYVSAWLEQEGFAVRRLGLLPDRFNVLGRWPGSGGGASLIFNSHMDTAVRAEDVWIHRDPTAAVSHGAWREGEELVGEGVVNDKGPMAAFMMAARAVRRAGIRLKGDLLLSAVVAETSHEPAGQPPGMLQESQDLGARFLVTHGGVADYALIAEGTGFSIVTVEAGMAWFKITYLSDEPAYYIPYLPDRTTMAASPNMIVRAARATEVLEQWAVTYQQSRTYQSPSGPVIPKAQVAAIRGGNPSAPMLTPQVTALYLCAFTRPGENPMRLREEIAAALAEAGVPASDVEPYLIRNGYEAKGAEPLVAALERAHHATFAAAPPPPNPATLSMWRDINSFNEVGIPAITYGPRSERHSWRKALKIDTLHDAAKVYARLILDICNQPPPR